jgi:hypothetical protein
MILRPTQKDTLVSVVYAVILIFKIPALKNDDFSKLNSGGEITCRRLALTLKPKTNGAMNVGKAKNWPMSSCGKNLIRYLQKWVV